MFSTTNVAASSTSAGGGGPVAAAAPPTFQMISSSTTHSHPVGGPVSSSSSTPVTRLSSIPSTNKPPTVVSIINGSIGVTSSASVPNTVMGGTALPASANIFRISTTQPATTLTSGQPHPFVSTTTNIILQASQHVRLVTPLPSLHTSLSATALPTLNNSNRTTSGSCRSVTTPLVASSNNIKSGICVDTPVLGRLVPLTLDRQQTAVASSTVTLIPSHALVQPSQASKIDSNINNHMPQSNSTSNGTIDEDHAKNIDSRPNPLPQSNNDYMKKISSTYDQSLMITSTMDDAMNSTQQDQEIELYVNNVVCSFALGCKLNLRKIAMESANVIYKRDQAMVLMKIRKPYCSANIWSSGKVTVTGTTSEEDAKRAARRIARILQRLGFKVKFRNYRVVNCLATCSMPWHIDIIKLSRLYPDDVSYEPEMHPGATVRLKDKAVLKVFTTGSVTLTAPSVERINSAVNDFYPQLFECRKQVPSNHDRQC